MSLEDENEIGLDDDECGDDEQDLSPPGTGDAEPPKDESAGREGEQPPAEPQQDQPDTKAPKHSLKDRLRLLKQKMNQARQLNRQAVQEEGKTGQVPNGKGWSKKEKAAKADPLTGQVASEVLHEARQASEKQVLRQYSAKDYHNPEGQFRNYQRNLQSLSYQQNQSNGDGAAASTATYDPTQTAISTEAVSAEREGARRLARELHRRIDKQKKKDLKRKQKEIEAEGDEDVSYINQRNKRFNQKINRTYDDATAEIRQNLERGTAL